MNTIATAGRWTLATAYAFDGGAGTLTEIETQSTLPPGHRGCEQHRLAGRRAPHG